MSQHLLSMRRGSGRALVNVHAIDGHILDYRKLARGMAPWLDVYGLQGIPSFLDGPRCGSFSEMTSRYAAEMCAAGIAADCIVVGYCMGGIIALELAHELTQRGAAPSLVVMIDSQYPMKPMFRRDGQLGRDGWLAFFEACAGRAYARSVASDQTFWKSALPDRLARAHSRAAAGLSLLLPQGSSAQAVQDTFERYTDFARAVDEHIPSPYAGRALCVGTSFSCESLRQNLVGKYLIGEVETIAVEGDHADFLTGATVDQVARHINEKVGAEAASARA